MKIKNSQNYSKLIMTKNVFNEEWKPTPSTESILQMTANWKD